MSKIKLCINGDRECTDYQFLISALKQFNINVEDVKEVVCGECRGADKLGEIWAKQNKIKIKPFPAKWDDISHEDALIRTNRFGKQYDAKAGFRRNKEMAEYSDVLLCLEPNGDTNGSQDCVDCFKKLKKPTNIYYGEKKKERGKYKF